MPNTVFGPYAPHTWNSGDAYNATRGNNLESQASVALHSFNPDMIGAGFVYSGITAAKDGTNANQLDIASGVAYVVFSDGTVGRITVVTDNTHTTATPSTTYHLYLQPDGTWYWSTSNAPAANSLHICDVTTDGSGNISTVTDLRPLYTTMFSGMAGNPGVPLIVGHLVDQLVSATTQQTYTVFTTGATGLYRISGSIYVSQTGPSTVTVVAKYTSGHDATNVPQLTFQSGSTNLSLASLGKGEWAMLPITMYCLTGTNIQILYTDSTGTPADKINAIVERLS